MSGAKAQFKQFFSLASFSGESRKLTMMECIRRLDNRGSKGTL